MVRKSSEFRKVQFTAEDTLIRHARIELTHADYERLKAAAETERLSVAAYIRQAVMERVEQHAQKERD
jgi:hypothetical protein